MTVAGDAGCVPRGADVGQGGSCRKEFARGASGMLGPTAGRVLHARPALRGWHTHSLPLALPQALRVQTDALNALQSRGGQLEYRETAA